MNGVTWKKSYRVIAALLGLWLLFDLVSYLTVEIFWFSKLGYFQEFWVRVNTQMGLWTLGFFASAGFLLSNLTFAERQKHQYPVSKEKEAKIIAQSVATLRQEPPLKQLPIGRYSAFNPRPLTHSSPQTQRKSGVTLRWLLPVVLGLSLLVGSIAIAYAQEALNIWYPTIELPTKLWHLPSWLQPIGLLIRYQEFIIPVVQSILLIALTIAILINHQLWLKSLALLVSLLVGFLLLTRWTTVLEYFYATSFNQEDPLFHRDISFYIFSLPVWELLEFWLLGLFLFGIAAVALVYLRSANSLSEGRFPGFTVAQRLHLNALGCLLLVTVAGRFWLLRFGLLYSHVGVNYGASYTDVRVLLPIYTGLSLLAIATAVYLLERTIVLSGRKQATVKRAPYPRQLVYVLGFFIAVATIGAAFLPAVVQQLIVKPNELRRERPYIDRTIAATRKAFNFDEIETQTFNPENNLTNQDIAQNELTIRNIRLWDSRPLIRSNRQLQQIRPYYKFLDADIDRYTLKTNRSNQTTEKQQTIIAARELAYKDVPDAAQTWINKHLVYTHGYGFTLSPVNRVAPGGLPYYYVKDIGIKGTGQPGELLIERPEIRASIPVQNPRIYYGEVTDTYVMTGTQTQELDYPSGNENVYNIYDGNGGISIDAPWRRLVFAEYLKDWQMLLTRNFTNQTKLLFRRSIAQRVKAIAPFLRYDSDPYLVAAAGGETESGKPSYLYWIIDAYTTSDRYPYSDPGKNKFNYIRNSVKVVVDAYNGDVNFYVADQSDPIIKTVGKIFPNLLKPLKDMPPTLATHIRYPLDYFSIQSDRLLAYHMTDPRVFYNREDQWQIPTEIYGTKPLPVDPYYLITKLPTAQKEEFILLLPFTPTQRRNLIAWLAARSDGNQYGKLLLYEFPKQELVYGPQQIEALINQDPQISQQITLWNREGSRVIQGNLLVIPIEQSLIYVEPLYLEAEQNSLPTLIRVVVAYNNRIVMAENLEQAFAALFESDDTAPIILRPLD